jgi:polysaccharide biosynthesis protein PslH
MTDRKSVLCLTTWFPWPADSGGCIRVDGLLRQLSLKYDVRLLVPREHDRDVTAIIVKNIESELGVAVETFEDPQWPKSRVAAKILWLKCLVVRIPPWVYGGLDRALLARFTELARDADAIVLLSDFTGMYPLLCPDPIAAPVVADKHVVLARPRSDDDGKKLRDRLFRRLTASFERRYLATASHVVVTTDTEAQWLTELYGRTPAGIIPTGVTIGPARPSRETPRRRVGWLSALDVIDNRDGLTRFLREGWPVLAEAGNTLFVAGRSPAPSVPAITAVPGVQLLGHVKSLEDFFAQIDVGVIPLWSGRGIKVKTLTFMAAGIPIAATPMAVEGMAVENGVHCLIGTTPAELAEHVQRLLADRALADAVAEAGRQFVMDAFNWDVVGAQFIAVVEQAMQVASGSTMSLPSERAGKRD